MAKYLFWGAVLVVVWQTYVGNPALRVGSASFANRQVVVQPLKGNLMPQGVTVYGGSDAAAGDRISATDLRRQYWRREGIAVYGGSDAAAVDRMAWTEVQRKYGTRQGAAERAPHSGSLQGGVSYTPRVAENGDVRGADNDGDGRREPVHVRGYYPRARLLSERRNLRAGALPSETRTVMPVASKMGYPKASATRNTTRP